MQRKARFRVLRISLPCLHAFAALGASPADDASSTAWQRDEVFRKVFGHPPPPFPIDSYMVVVVDGTRRLKLRAELPSGDTRIRLEGKPLIALLSPLLRQDLVDELEQQIDSRGFIDSGALEQAGIGSAFEPRAFEYALITTPAMRVANTLYITPPLPDPLTEQALRPAGLSGFLNFNLKATDRRVSEGGHRIASADLGVGLDGALNVHGLTLEGSAFGMAGDRDTWRRGDMRLVYDWPREALRLIAGDLIYPVTGYQTLLPAGGIGISKDYSLQPQRLTYWTGDFSFRLDRSAEARIFLNGSLISTLQLPAGVHDLRRFMPAVGQNDIDVAIEDATGRRDTIHFSFIHDPSLLDAGLSRYASSIGFAREPRDGQYHYDTDRPVFSGSYLRGLTAATTMGGYTEFTHERALLGLQTLQALPIGTLLLDAALSRTRDGRADGAARISLTSSAARRRPEAQLSVEYLGMYFNSIGTIASRPRDMLNVQANLALPLPSGLTGRFSTGFQSASGPDAQRAYGSAMTFFQRWGRHTTASLSLRHQRTLLGTDTSLLFGLRASLSGATGTYQAAKDLEGDRVSAQWNSPRRSALSTPYGFAGLRTDPRLREYQAGVGYTGNQGMAEVTFLRSENEAAAGERREEAAARLEGALVFADGAVALSRTVRENFVIVAGKAGLDGVVMKVDPDGRRGNQAKSNWLGPAVLTDLGSYRLRSLRIEPQDAPLGAVPERLSFQLAPTYKSGMLLRIGKDQGIVAIGRLVDAAGAPIAYLAISIHRIDDPEAPPVVTFTNGNGGFQAPDLVPGQYEIRPSGALWGSATLDIPRSPDDIRRLGDILLPPAG